MRKLRLYLDTSVISNICAPHVPDKEKATNDFFRLVAEKSDEYELFISVVGLAEIADSPEPKLSRFRAFLDELRYTSIPYQQEADNLASLYVDQGVLSENHIEDLMHVAYAVVAHCDYVISWNMKHLVRAHTISRVNEVNFHNNYQNIFIATPIIIIGE